MRVLHRLGRDHAARELEPGAVPLEVLLAPHRRDDPDRLLPLVPARAPVDVERRLLLRSGATGSPLHPSGRQDVGGCDLLRHTRRVREPERQQRHAETQSDVPGGLSQRADHHLGRGAVRLAFAEVVLDEPGDVEPELVGQLDLLQRIPVRALFTRTLAVRVGSLPRRR